MPRTILEIDNHTFQLRIKAKYVKMVQEKLEGKNFSDAIFDLMDNPVSMSTPFFWGMLQSNQTELDEFDLYDELVKKGYRPAEFANLVIDICDGSGFFTEAQTKALRNLPSVMSDLNQKLLGTMTEKLKEIEVGKKVQPSSRATNLVSLTDMHQEISGKAPTVKRSNGSKQPSNEKK